ncbi:kelch repeat and BTB domain-containing protein 3-like [Physella acuta]|uniref:kelch repeat and BTB domain-containing protein 3-like n=1 Tax=Physella acuta TaxID=109671 RepID=UPI0027DB9901|nr:kelch repeat and BTB domain-containing protein 3-like [Physella acuta]
MVKSTLACGLQECLSKEWMGDNFRDFRVVVDGSEYFCHKFILSACSTFFKTLLGSDFKENKDERVELKNMSKEIFDVIINAIYKGVDGLTLDNIISVWQATHMLHIPFLIEECERFVVENMSLDNYIVYYPMAKLLNSENVITFTIGFMKENFEPFCVTETFLEFSFPMLFSFVDDDRLKVKSEDLVLESIISWVSYVQCKPHQVEYSDTETNNTQATAIEKTDEIQNYKSQEKLIN